MPNVNRQSDFENISGFVQFPPTDAPDGRSQRDHREQPHQQRRRWRGPSSPLRDPAVPRPARHQHPPPHLQEEEGLGGDPRREQQVGRGTETASTQVTSLTARAETCFLCIFSDVEVLLTIVLLR